MIVAAGHVSSGRKADPEVTECKGEGKVASIQTDRDKHQNCHNAGLVTSFLSGF